MPSLTWELDAIARCATQYRTEMLAPLGLKSCHASYLLQICKNPGISQEQLARRIYFNKSSVARQLAVLEEAGFIRRTTSETDRRVTQLFPTDKAIALLPQIRQVLLDWEDLITQGLSPQEQTALREMLLKLKDLAARRVQPD
ncbi:MAG: MarR family transcriptional regulator [Firmicutes bacterium]|nr:MarR family transcriptional regulator [Clostridiales bacterium]MDD7651754.1 MarR family transcriptional regulator [Bacillota bacterium]